MFSKEHYAHLLEGELKFEGLPVHENIKGEQTTPYVEKRNFDEREEVRKEYTSQNKTEKQNKHNDHGFELKTVERVDDQESEVKPSATLSMSWQIRIPVR